MIYLLLGATALSAIGFTALQDAIHKVILVVLIVVVLGTYFLYQYTVPKVECALGSEIGCVWAAQPLGSVNDYVKDSNNKIIAVPHKEDVVTKPVTPVIENGWLSAVFWGAGTICALFGICWLLATIL